jgi:pimeloyl-ACP methyl ester carboxylesterase
MKSYVYKSEECMRKMHQFYEEELEALDVKYEERYFDTSFGNTHVLVIGDQEKQKIFTLHGGNGINPLNIRIFEPLLEKYCIIAPDVIGMPGKSAPYRTLDSKKDDYGIWLTEVLNQLHIDRIMFVVSSYSSAMLLSLAKIHPEKIIKAVLLVPSGIAHGPIIPIIRRMALPFVKYYSHPTQKSLNGIMETMITSGDDVWRRFLHLMMSGYKMEMRPPREFRHKELSDFKAPIFIIASSEDIFFPADKVFAAADKLFKGRMFKMHITGKHLPSKETMLEVCKRIEKFDQKTSINPMM